jgi:hypothetical protein
MRKTSLALLTALLSAGCMAAPASPTEQNTAKAAAPPPGAGFIEKVDYTGTGCEGSATTGISPDKQAVTSIFSDFVASSGPGAAPELATRNCLIMMDVKVPSGWQYSLESVDYRGFAGLERDVTASRQSLYVISGSSVHVTPVARFKGEINDDYTHGDVGPDAPGRWSPCGGGQVLWIATQTAVNTGGRERSGQLAVDTIDTELQWRRCE